MKRWMYIRTLIFVALTIAIVMGMSIAFLLLDEYAPLARAFVLAGAIYYSVVAGWSAYKLMKEEKGNG